MLYVNKVADDVISVIPDGRYAAGPPGHGHERHQSIAVGDTLRLVNAAGNGDLLVELPCGCKTLLTPLPTATSMRMFQSTFIREQYINEDVARPARPTPNIPAQPPPPTPHTITPRL